MTVDDITPDTKDWTWVLERRCPECGFDASDVDPADIAERLRVNAEHWRIVLGGRDVRTRPRPTVWSPLEYAAHVRDVHLLFAERLRLMLEQDRPRFPNWDQDATAREARYDLLDPAVVARELLDAAVAVAALYDAVPPGSWARSGVRSNGSEFTVETLGIYHLHDVVHHLWDVERGGGAVR